jgi:drug/metabolite transporter (DMT)-like permease
MVYVKLFLTALLWGGTFVAARVVAQQADPLSASFLRFFIASVCLYILVLKKQGAFPKLNGRLTIIVIMLGMSGVAAYNIFFFHGLKTIPASRATLIIATNPVFIALFSVLFFHEKFRVIGVAGILLCLAGAITVITKGNPPAILSGGMGSGELFIVGCVASWVIYSLIGKVIMEELSPLSAVAYSCIIGCAGLLIPAVFEGMYPALLNYGAATWAGLFYLGFFGTVVGFIWYYEGIKEIGAARAGVFINFVPASGVFLGWLILDETVDWSLLAGACLIIGGVFLTNSGRIEVKAS